MNYAQLRLMHNVDLVILSEGGSSKRRSYAAETSLPKNALDSAYLFTSTISRPKDPSQAKDLEAKGLEEDLGISPTLLKGHPFLFLFIRRPINEDYQED
jgi:hypothetical protein